MPNFLSQTLGFEKQDSGDFCFQDIHVSASNFLFHDDKKKGDSCPNWNINMCVSCLHTQLWAKPMRRILKYTNSYPKQYYRYIPGTILFIPGFPSLLHVGHYIFTVFNDIT